MSEPDVLRRLDDALDPLLTAGPPPVVDLATRGRSVRRRRAGVRAGLAAAAAVVAVVVGLTVVGTQGAGTLTALPTAAPAPDPGDQVVGLGAVSLTVPGDWVPSPSCGAEAPAVAFAAPGAKPCKGPLVVLASVAFGDMTWATEPLNDLQVVRRGSDCGDTRTDSVIVCNWEETTRLDLPDEGVIVLVGAPSASGPLRERIAATARSVPDGQTAVPPVDPEASFEQTCGNIANAGLEVPGGYPSGCAGFAPWPVVTTDPAPGTVVPLASSVALVTRRDERRVGSGGVSVVTPPAWTSAASCPGTRGLRVSDGCDGPGVSFLPAILPPGDERRTIGGLQVAIHYGCPPNAGCLPPTRPIAYVIVFALDVQVTISAPTRAGIDQIIASLAPIPDGFVAVPEVGYGVSDAEAALALENAGLVADLAEVDFPHDVTGTEPTAGSVVALGSTVRISVGDG